MIKINVQKYNPIISFVLFFALIAGYIYIIFGTHNIHHNSDRYLTGKAFGVLFPALLVFCFNKEVRVSEILIFDRYIEIVYKTGGKEVDRIQILKKDIEKFNVTTEAELKNRHLYYYRSISNTVNIKTKNEEFEFSNSSENTLGGCSYQLLLDLIKYRKEIPNFEYDVSAADILIRKEAEYFCQCGKRLPLKERVKYFLNQTPIMGKLFLFVFIILLIPYFALMAFFFMPTGKLTDTEKEYMQHYDKAVSLRVEQKNYLEALNELEEAEKCSSITAETYLEKAYNYKKLQQYDKGIIAVKEGLKYVDSKSIYNKYNNIRISDKKDIALYTVLGELYEKIKDYKSMKDSYDYVINHTDFMYTDAYFNRGVAEYHLLEFDLAFQDMLKHKEIIQSYLASLQKETRFKIRYPLYDNRSLENVELWIKALKKYGNIN